MLQPLGKTPALTVPLVGGGSFTLGAEAPEAFDILVFYRGKHCPICRDYLKAIQGELDAADALGARVVAISMDEAERAQRSAAEWGIDRLAVGYAMPEATARAWGLYISSARAGSAEPAVFSEPGLVVLRPDGTVFFVQLQSAPFTRPDFGKLIGGLRFVLDNDYPARGDLTQAA
ncbi:MAG: peroxiredoxin-like family protein [Pseudomonadota bacterium]